MPCRDYSTDDSNQWMREQYKEQCDKLARIACAAMTELVKHGKADFLVLQNDEVREWWEQHQIADQQEQQRVAEKKRQQEIRQAALNRLTDEEKRLLGLTHKKKDVLEELWNDEDEINQ